MKRLIFAPVFLVIIILLSSSHAICEPWANQDGLIAFYSNRTGNQEIYVMKPDGSDQRQLTNDGDQKYDCTWSPDGTKLFYLTYSGSLLKKGQYELHVIDVATGSEKVIGSDIYREERPVWSPDSKMILYSVRCNGKEDIFLSDIDGHVVNLTNNDFADKEFFWSPDSTKFLFESTRDGKPNIFMMDINSRQVTRITNNNDQNIRPSWSPNGIKFAYITIPSSLFGKISVILSSFDDNKPQKLNIEGERLHWSPDGTRLIIENIKTTTQRTSQSRTDDKIINHSDYYLLDLSHPSLQPKKLRITGPIRWLSDSRRLVCGNNTEFTIVDIEGEQKSIVLKIPFGQGEASPSPDGSRIACRGFDGLTKKSSCIYVANTDGTRITKISNNWDYSPLWSPK